MTRQEMVDALIEENFDNMDLKALWYFFEYHQQEEFKTWTTETIEKLYEETFIDE